MVCCFVNKNMETEAALFSFSHPPLRLLVVPLLQNFKFYQDLPWFCEPLESKRPPKIWYTLLTLYVLFLFIIIQLMMKWTPMTITTAVGETSAKRKSLRSRPTNLEPSVSKNLCLTAPYALVFLFHLLLDKKYQYLVT